jgi:dipeptidyl aminopeptidase/acylaminoacyl peptidase
VNAVLILPSTYTVDGDPTPLIFMHHGRSGTVTDSTWYSTVANWPNFYNAYLNAGYAVFDVNGAGPYAADNTFNHDYGCPNCILAAYKAYEYIRAHYNVDRKIFVHGTSMGGITAVSFAKNFSNIVRAVGVFSTADLRNYAVTKWPEEVAPRFGYVDAAAMAADGYSELPAFELSVEHYNSSGARQFHGYDYNWKADSTEIHVSAFPVPIKYWHGTADESTSYTWSEEAVKAIRKGGGMAYYRPIAGAGHDICTGGNSTVISEAVMWFNRFR